jgi:uncharacterized membrane protein
VVLGQPLVGAIVGGALVAAAARCGIDKEFVRAVEAGMTPGASVLFVMDEWCDREAVLYQLGGLGGKVLKTNVDPELAKQVQAALAAAPAPPK